MTTAPPLPGGDIPGGQPAGLSTAETIQLWQHFVRTAGEDKNRMIGMTTWLLGLSASIVGYVATHADTPHINLALSRVGMAVSVFALYIVWLYWAHEQWNRGKAEALVGRDSVLGAILPAKDRPRGGAWVFGLFLLLALSSLIIHVVRPAG
jgi:hypothetical protein